MKKQTTENDAAAIAGSNMLASSAFQCFYEPEGHNKEKIIRYQNSGHVWKEDEDGEVTVFAHSEGYCNGPECVVCGYSPCWHCEPFPKPGNCR